MNFDFGEILTRAWQIIWKHKILWIFGILASCGQGSGGGNSGGGGGNSGFDTQGQNLPPQIMQWFNTIEQNITSFIAAGIAIICIIWILVMFLSTIGRIGLIRGTFQAEGGAESLIFGQLFSESMPYFWRMFGLSLIIALPVLFVVGALFAGIIVFAMSAGSGNDASMLGIVTMVPILIGCMCLLVPVMFVVGMVIRQSQNAIVLEDMSLMPALSRGWDVFRANLGPIIVMAIILAIIGFVAGLIIAIPVFLIVFPAIFALIMGQGETYSPLIFMAVCMCIYIPIALVLQGILTAYTESAWTLTYMRITQPPQQDEDAAMIEANA
ncbi:MAG TPA: hypothetical protein VJ972_03375 [Anaerolineales bacterium]|nr:hypothetical protein [Anaerolineales bacterium]